MRATRALWASRRFGAAAQSAARGPPICFDFRDKGTCRFGDACRFTHANPFRRKKAQSSAAALNETLLAARKPSELLAAWDATRGGVWNGVNVATALHRLSASCHAEHRPRIRASRSYDEIVRFVSKRAGTTTASAAAQVEHGGGSFFGPRELASVARSIATVGLRREPLATHIDVRRDALPRSRDPHAVFRALASGSVWHASEMEAHDLTKLCWAFATARADSPSLFRALAREAAPRIDALDGRQLSMLAWGFAHSGHGGRPRDDDGACERSARLLLSAVGDAAVAPRVARATSPRDLATTAWALAISDARRYAPAIAALWSAVFAEDAAHVLSWEEWTMLRQVQLAFDLDAGESGAPPLAAVNLAAQKQNASTIERAWNEPLATGARPSFLQREVSTQLRGLGWSHSEELVVDDALGALDMGCPHERVAVEFDGPSHFVRCVERPGVERDSGPTKWKAHVVRTLGWRCARVHYYEWLQARALGAGAADAFLRRKMASVGVAL